MRGCDECQILGDIVLPPQFNCMACHKIITSENKQLREALAIAEGEWKTYFKANERLSEKLDEAIKCIEFYANFRNYSHYMDSEMPVYRAILFSDTEEINDMTKYAGKLARTTLKAIKGMG